MKYFLSAAVAAASLGLLANVSAEDGPASPHEWSANVLIGSEYLYRGISQTNEGPTIQGGFDYSYMPWGFYFGTWASNLEYNAGVSDGASAEIDFYGGFAGEFANGTGWDVGGLYYWYPDQNEDSGGGDYSFFEVYGNLSHTFAGAFEPTISAGLAYSPDFFGETGDAIYVSAGLDLSLPNDFGLYFNFGYQDVDESDSYEHWGIGITKDVGILSFDLSWNDAEEDGCMNVGGVSDDLCSAVVFSVSSSW